MPNTTFPEQRQYAFFGVENPYANPANPTGPDVLYFEEGDFTWSREILMRPRGAASPGRSGFRPCATEQHCVWSLSNQEVAMIDIVTADDADAPPQDKLFRCCGFERVSDVATRTHTYILRPYGHESISIRAFDVDRTDSDNQEVTIIGARADFTLNWENGDFFRISNDGMGLVLDEDPFIDMRSTLAGSTVEAPVYYDLKPFVCKGGTIKILNLDDGDAPYGGGDKATLLNEVLLKRFDVSGNMNPVMQHGGSSTAAVGRIALRPTDMVEATLVVEQTAYTEWHPWNQMFQGQRLECNFLLEQPGAPNNTLQILFYGQVMTVSRGIEEGERSWEMSVMLLHPADAAGGVIGAGDDPNQQFNTGTDQGLIATPAGGLVPGILALQFRTT